MILQYILLQEESLRHAAKRNEQSSRLEITSEFRKVTREQFPSLLRNGDLTSTARAHPDPTTTSGTSPSRRKALQCPLDKDPKQYVTQYVHRTAPENTLKTLLAEYHRLSPVSQRTAPVSGGVEENGDDDADEDDGMNCGDCVYNNWDPVSPPSDRIKGLLASLPEVLLSHNKRKNRDGDAPVQVAVDSLRSKNQKQSKHKTADMSYERSEISPRGTRGGDRKDSTLSRRSVSSNPSVILSAVDDEKIFREYLKKIEKRAHALVGIATIDTKMGSSGVSPKTLAPPGLTAPTEGALSVFSSMDSNGSKPSKGRHAV